MKNIIFFIFVFLSFGLFAQENPGEISLNNLDVPDSPAFILLDEAPSTIQRPNSSRAFGLSLLQDVATDGVLSNIAIEVTPFWMMKHPKMNALRFYGVDENLKQNPFSKLRLATVSAAYMRDSDSVVNVAIGARTTVFELKRQSDVSDYKNMYNSIEQLLYSALDYMDEYEQTNPEPEREDFETEAAYIVSLQSYREARAQYVREREAQVGVDITKNAETFQKILNRKPALALDVAAAYNHRFLSNEFNNNGFGRLGIWSTLSASTFLDKRPSSYNYVNLYGFFRYLRDGSLPIPTSDSNDRFNAFDIGVKAELEFEKLVVGYEYISRSGDIEGYRSAGSIKYQIFQDIFVTGTFGNNFAEQDDLITFFGIQWGVNHPFQTIAIPEEN